MALIYALSLNDTTIWQGAPSVTLTRKAAKMRLAVGRTSVSDLFLYSIGLLFYRMNSNLLWDCR